MRENYTLTRLYIETDLSRGQGVPLSEAQRHYLINVLRRKSGDRLRVFNGTDGEWRAQILDLSKKSFTIEVLERLRAPKACPDITLCFAPVRKHRNAFIAEKATELGVSRLQPVITARTQFPKINLDKMGAQIIEAAEQTERLDIPALSAPISLAVMIDDFKEHMIFFADEVGGAMPAIEAIRLHAGPAVILIGPEGGFTDQEREILQTKDNVVLISLGPRILRADTAALSVLTLWQSVHGDW